MGFTKRLRLLYWLRFAGRIAILILVVLLYLFWPQNFRVLTRFSFFKRFSPLHLLWGIWMADMLLQLVPSHGLISLGAQKPFQVHMFPSGRPVPRQAIRNANRLALTVGLLWTLLTATIGVLYGIGLFSTAHLFIITTLFYVFDLVCVLIWCPFQVLFLKNRCCTTCRIFNWDHLMMFSPLLFVPGFYTWTLAGMAVLVLLVWEIQFARHPERFFPQSNAALRCDHCTDRLRGKRCAGASISQCRIDK